MNINPEIFKAYDIRGIYPQEINKETAYLIGQAFVRFLKKRNPRIVIGQDNRFSSPLLFDYLAKGINDQGGEVVDIGLSTTPMLYFAAAHFGYDGGIEISASHNPAQYNGFKLVKERALPISGESGLKEIKRIVLNEKFDKKSKGAIVKKEVLKHYIKFNFEKFNLERLKRLRIIVDTANAVPGILIPEISKKINSEIYHLFPDLNGSFPNHPPNPLKKENLKSLSREIKTKKFDLGIAFDGDGDRITFIDQSGEAVSGDLITALIAQLTLKESRGEKVLYDIRSSNIVREAIEEAKGVPLVWKIGHSLIKEKMRKENVLFGGEFSGHYYHRDHYFSECPIFILFKILEAISVAEKPFSEVIEPFRKYFHSGEISFEVKDKEETLNKLEQEFKSGQILKIDGLRVDFKDWWFLVRPSNTEPLIRLVAEAKKEKLMKEKVKRIESIIKNC